MIAPLIHIAEPLLEFGFGQKRAYPRDGLFMYGPVDGGLRQIQYGAIGTPDGIRRLEQWAGSISAVIPPPDPRKGAREIEPQHVLFPGFAPAFGVQWPTKPHRVIATIDSKTLADALRLENRNEAIKVAVDMYVNALVAAANRLEDPPSFWFVVIPEC
jgi:hypothetical protein